MAEMIIDMPATALKSDKKGDLVRRYSIANFVSQPTTVENQRVPHYLRASTGSCHDSCKIGSVPHVVEAKARTPFTERYVKTVDKTQYQSRKSTNSNSRNKKTVLKIQAPYKCEVIIEKEVPKSTPASDLKLKPVKTKVSSNNNRIDERKKSSKASMKKSSMMTKRLSLSAPTLLNRKLPEITMPKVEKTPQKIFPLNEENKESVIPEKIFFIPEPEAENDSLTCLSPLSADRTDLIATSSDTEIMDRNNEIINADEGTCEAESPQSTLCSIDCFDQNNHNEQEQKPRRMRRAVSEKSISSLQNVKFARGKEVNLQIDDNGTSKAKFRQGTVLENQNGKAENRRRRLRRLVPDLVTDKVKTGPVKKVSLRHQEVKGRMKPRLVSDVIEETASKLVESRKSKVKALVGAFETVISLQDRKKSKKTTNAS